MYVYAQLTVVCEFISLFFLFNLVVWSMGFTLIKILENHILDITFSITGEIQLTRNKTLKLSLY